MNKIFLVFKNELISTITRRSYIITLLLVPVVSGIIMLVVSVLGQNTSQVVSQMFSSTPKAVIEGYVDQSGLIKKLPDGINSSELIAYPDEAHARQALAQGAISSFYIIPADYIKSGKVFYIRNDFNPLSGLNQARSIDEVIQFNLIGGNQSLARQLNAPMQLNRVNLKPETPQRDQGSFLTFFLPYAVTMIFYIVILTAASLMLNSVTGEKQNRIMEILMVSMTPTQMLTGKILALGLVGLLQTIVWTSAGYILLILSGQKLNFSAAFTLPPSILLWGMVFFLLGYFVYAGLMSGVGALVPNLREASQATTIMVIPMIIPLMFISTMVNAPNGAISMALSLFPLTAPVAMMTRLAAGVVPTWEILLSIALLAVTGLLIIRSVAGMFRAQTLLSGQAFNYKVFFKALVGLN